MDRIFHQLTVLAAGACLGIISLSVLFPTHRQADVSSLSSDTNNSVIIIQSEKNTFN